MTNLTLAIDKDTLKRARITATNRGTTVNALVRDYLGKLANEGLDQRAMLRDMFLMADTIGAKSNPAAKRWTRDEINSERWESSKMAAQARDPRA
jgi:hypothetical protein